VPAGLFCGDSQSLVDQQAFSYACKLAASEKICLGPLPRCLCYGVFYTANIVETPGRVADFELFSGSLPPGLTLHSGTNSFGFVTIDGTPTQAGTFNFSIKATTTVGTFMVKAYVLTVIQVTTTTLDPYTVGTPYSFQLQATGGSGNYAWNLLSGALPDGLVLDVSGLVHGTPTGVNTGTMPLVFEVADLTCEALNQAFFTPRVALVTHSRTTIATVLGYPEFVASSPPKKYHNITWDGMSEQFIFTAVGHGPAGHAQYLWTGTGSIDTTGKQTSNYSKILLTQCPAKSNFFDYAKIRQLVGVPVFSPRGALEYLVGYCWGPDPNSCPVCADPLQFVGDVQQNSTTDTDDFINDPGSGTQTRTSTQLVNNSTAQLVIALVTDTTVPGFVSNFPITTINDIIAAWTSVSATHDYIATLDTEYTDAEASQNAQVINSNGSSAQTLNRTTGYVSTNTSVNFDLNFSNLVVGKAYTATVKLLDSNGTLTTRSYGFMATGTTQTIHDSVPTPDQGHTITVLLPTVVFV
jgi:hypothetical protein